MFRVKVKDFNEVLRQVSFLDEPFLIRFMNYM